MNLYSGDLHVGHRNAINFDQRPFADRDEMDEALIHLWNGRVQNDDDVWILGDFCYRSDKDPVEYLKRLKGKKHLIVGNHDGVILKNKKALEYFETVEQMHTITDIYNKEPIQVVLCHYPLAEWNGMYRGAWHVYGHIHNNKNDTYEFMKTKERALNAGCMINNYTPVSFRELVENNKRFQNQ